MEQWEKETLAHILTVRDLLQKVRVELIHRGQEHDASKLKDPEREAFAVQTPKLKGLTYGSDEYKAILREIKPAIDHHYAVNRHHPEHFPEGIEEMTLLDLIEML
jgi:hypothetical protein